MIRMTQVLWFEFIVPWISIILLNHQLQFNCSSDSHIPCSSGRIICSQKGLSRLDLFDCAFCFIDAKAALPAWLAGLVLEDLQIRNQSGCIWLLISLPSYLNVNRILAVHNRAFHFNWMALFFRLPVLCRQAWRTWKLCTTRLLTWIDSTLFKFAISSKRIVPSSRHQSSFNIALSYVALILAMHREAAPPDNQSTSCHNGSISSSPAFSR